MSSKDFLERSIGIEIELTGITRNKAARVIAEHFQGSIEKKLDSNSSYNITTPDSRVWKVVYDASIRTQKKVNGQKVEASKEYSVEIVSPILNYKKDIKDLQELVRKIRKAGGFSEKQNCTGIHIHLNGKDLSPTSLRNFINIIYSSII